MVCGAGLQSVDDYFPRLAYRRTQRADTSSGGERQMLAVGRALMSQPRLLMLEKPSLGLAPLIVVNILAICAKTASRSSWWSRTRRSA